MNGTKKIGLDDVFSQLDRLVLEMLRVTIQGPRLLKRPLHHLACYVIVEGDLFTGIPELIPGAAVVTWEASQPFPSPFKT